METEDTAALRNGHSFEDKIETVAQKTRDSSGKTGVTQGEGHIREMETASWKPRTLQP